MRLEDITAEVRPRGRWEAVDLGFALTRRYFGRMLLAWLFCVGPIWAVVLWSSQWIGIGWALFLLWWWKPLYERLPLFILSRALFGPPPRLRETLRAWPRLLTSDLWHALVGARLSGTRTLMMPVSMLEGLRGKERKQRAAVIIRHSGGCAGSLTFLCALYESVLVIATATLMGMFIPVEGSIDWIDTLTETGFTRGVPPALLWTIVGCWLIAMTVVELFFSGAGFGLYLNTRTHLEGWDVELAFRRLGRRLGGMAAAIFAVISILPGLAQESAIGPDKAEAREEISRILGNENFKVHKVESWESRSNFKLNSGGDGSFLSALGYVVFWAAVAFAVWHVARFIIRHWHTLRGLDRTREKAAVQPARTVAGLDVAPESLPEDVVAAARQRWLAGDPRGALSLLYRGSLSWLVNTLCLPIQDSDTEGDCLRRAADIAAPGSRDYFTRLTQHWVTAAYGGHAPPASEMETLLETWPYHRDQRRQTSP
jgi:hypothetical protein